MGGALKKEEDRLKDRSRVKTWKWEDRKWGDTKPPQDMWKKHAKHGGDEGGGPAQRWQGLSTRRNEISHGRKFLGNGRDFITFQGGGTETKQEKRAEKGISSDPSRGRKVLSGERIHPSQPERYIFQTLEKEESLQIQKGKRRGKVRGGVSVKYYE